MARIRGGGYAPLREWIADYQDVAREQVIVTNGSMQADAFLFKLLVQPGDTVVVEAPTRTSQPLITKVGVYMESRRQVLAAQQRHNVVCRARSFHWPRRGQLGGTSTTGFCSRAASAASPSTRPTASTWRPSALNSPPQTGLPFRPVAHPGARLRPGRVPGSNAEPPATACREHSRLAGDRGRPVSAADGAPTLPPAAPDRPRCLRRVVRSG